MAWRNIETDEWREWNQWSGGVANESVDTSDSGDAYAGESDPYAIEDHGYAGGSE